MRNSICWMIAVLLSASTLVAATADDFYDEAFRRGVAAYEAGSYEAALPSLRIAAFGFIDDIPRYEAVESYIAVSARRISRNDEAKSALQRIVAADRLGHTFAKLQLTPALRGAVEEAAKGLLTSQMAVVFTMPPPESQISSPTPTPPPAKPPL